MPVWLVFLWRSTSGSSNPVPLTVINGVLFFAANNGTNGAELWSTDGSEGGTTMIAEIHPGAASSGPAGFSNYNGTLLFGATDDVNGSELWRFTGGIANVVWEICPLPACGSLEAGAIGAWCWRAGLFQSA